VKSEAELEQMAEDLSRALQAAYARRISGPCAHGCSCPGWPHVRCAYQIALDKATGDLRAFASVREEADRERLAQRRPRAERAGEEQS
jgi:hypothetical protein